MDISDAYCSDEEVDVTRRAARTSPLNRALGSLARATSGRRDGGGWRELRESLDGPDAEGARRAEDFARTKGGRAAAPSAGGGKGLEPQPQGQEPQPRCQGFAAPEERAEQEQLDLGRADASSYGSSEWSSSSWTSEETEDLDFRGLSPRSRERLLKGTPAIPPRRSVGRPRCRTTQEQAQSERATARAAHVFQNLQSSPTFDQLQARCDGARVLVSL